MSSYALHQLGWHNFQQLCLTIAREVLGQPVQSFLDSKDGGRDGAFAGTWSQRKGEDLQGTFVIQCKFTSKPDRPLRISELTDELAKAKRLVKKGRCDCYILLTNFGVSGVQDEKIEEKFLGIGVKHVLCLGATWICDQIRTNSRLRMLVPRVYGLGDLSQILDARAYSQAHAVLASMREDLSRVVLTGVYSRAVAALEDHGFVLLLGEPACGKTTIAAMLAMAAIDQWKVSTLKLETSLQIVERWNPEEPNQFFWIDDAFGVTQYEAPLALDWNRIFPKISTMLKAGARIVLTSRDYIYNRAKKDLKESAFPLMRESQVVVNVQDIKLDERRQILYNHIKLGDQKKSFRREMKPFLGEVASHPRFSPEMARRLGNSQFTRGLHVSQATLVDFVERQEQLLLEVIEGLDKHSLAALALIFMRNDALESPVNIRSSEDSSLSRLGSSLGDTLLALMALHGSLTTRVTEENRLLWRFKHPTIGDAFGAMVLENPELMDIYIHGVPIDKLLETITCGDVGLTGAVVVPSSLYDLILRKLSTVFPDARAYSTWDSWEIKFRAFHFLARRCSREFLKLYLEDHPALLKRISTPRQRLDFVPEVDLALSLSKLGLLPEENRKLFAQTIIQYAVEGSDGCVLRRADLRQILTREENEELISRVKAELVPNLKQAWSDWEINHDSNEDPESYVQPFAELLSAISNEFPDDQYVLDKVKSQESQMKEWVQETLQFADESRPSEPEDLDVEPDYYRVANEAVSERDIFEDVDA